MILHHDIARLVIINYEEATWKSSEALTDTPYNPPLKTQPHFPAPVSLEAKEIPCSILTAGKISCKLICIMRVDCPHNSVPWFLWRALLSVPSYPLSEMEPKIEGTNNIALSPRLKVPTTMPLPMHSTWSLKSKQSVPIMQGIYLLAAQTTHRRNKLCCLEKVMMANWFLVTASH